MSNDVIIAVICAVCSGVLTVVMLPVLSYFIVRRDAKIDELEKDRNEAKAWMTGANVELRELNRRAEKASERPPSFTNEVELHPGAYRKR